MIMAVLLFLFKWLFHPSEDFSGFPNMLYIDTLVLSIKVCWFMNKSLLIIVGGVLIPAAMALAFGYWAWVSRSAFMTLYSFITNWSDFNLMVVTLLFSGFFMGFSVIAIAMVAIMKKDESRQRERQEMKEEVRKELEMETQKSASV